MNGAISSDLSLARRLEAVEAAQGVSVVCALQKNGREAAVEPFLGGQAIFAGVGAPMTHALGIGMSGPASVAEFDAMEAFFRTRGSPVLIDLCPLAHETVWAFLRDRDYRIIELNNVLVADPRIEVEEPNTVERVASGDLAEWTRTIMMGFSNGAEVPKETVGLMKDCFGDFLGFKAVHDGRIVAGGMMNIEQNVASFIGDATLVEARGQGIQQAIIRRRLAEARRRGCDLAMVCVVPGTPSHRNYERAGFRLAYMRVNVMKD